MYLIDELNSHITNIMDCYCRFYDNRCENETVEGELVPSIFDNGHRELFDEKLKEVAKYACTYMKIDYNSLSDKDYATCRAKLVLKNQYNMMHEKLNDVQLLRYLSIFYHHCYDLDKNTPLSDQQLDEFKRIYLDASLDNYFTKYVNYSVRLNDLYDKLLSKGLTNSEQIEYDNLEEDLSNAYKNIDAFYLKSSFCFDRVIAKREDNYDRSYFKQLYNRELMRLVNPMVDASSWTVLLDRYVTAGKTVMLDKCENAKHDIGLFYARNTLLGQEQEKQNLLIEKLEHDSAAKIKMFDDYFYAYNHGYQRYDKYLKTLKKI